MISTRNTITTTATKIVSKAVNETRNVYIYTDGAGVYLGGSNVTTGNGLLIHKDTAISFIVPPNEELWAITSSGTHALMTLTAGATLQP